MEKFINNYEGIYTISDDGVVKKLGYGEMTLCADAKGYLRVSLTDKNGCRKTHKAHRLVANAFIQNTQNNPQVNHIDGNKKNNSVSNLEWCTNKENAHHAIKNGLFVKVPKEQYEKMHKIVGTNMATFTVDEASEICEAVDRSGLSMREMAKTLNIYHKTISRIYNNKQKYFKEVA